MKNFWKHNKKFILYDTSFWCDIIKDKDKLDFWNEYKYTTTILLPYPTLYEFFNDKLFRNHELYKKIKEIFSDAQIGIEYYDDKNIHDNIKKYFSINYNSKNKSETPNLVDMAINDIILNRKIPFVFATNTIKDFYGAYMKNINYCYMIDFSKKTPYYNKT